MKAVFLLPDIIWPPVSGGQKAMYYRIIEFSKKHDVYIIAINSSENHQCINEDTFFKCQEVTKDILIFERISVSLKKVNWWQCCNQIFKWIFSGKPRFAQTFHSEQLNKTITEYILRHNINTVFIESPYICELINIPILKSNKVKIICVMHNIEHIFFAEAFDENSWFKKKIISYECNRIKKYEYKIFKQSDVIIGIADWDVNFLEKDTELAINKSIYLPALLPDPEAQWDKNSKSDYIIFAGSLSFYPNYHGILWFLENVFKEYTLIKPNVKLKITGTIRPDIYIKLQKYNNVELTGFLSINELIQTISGALFNIVPIQKGAGVKVKLLEAMSMGMPIITTLKGAQGIPFNGDAPFLIAENHEEFLNYMVQLTDDNYLRENLSIRTKTFFNSNYEVTHNINKWINSLKM